MLEGTVKLLKSNAGSENRTRETSKHHDVDRALTNIVAAEKAG